MRSRRTAAAAAAAVLAVLAGQGPAAQVVASAPIGPSGLPAEQRTYNAGLGPGESEVPHVAPPDAVVADRDSVGDQLAYAKQASALPVSRSQRWASVGPFGMDNPPGYPTAATRYARSTGMGTAAAVDPRKADASTVYVGNMGGLWKSTDSGRTWANLSGTFARSAIGAVAVDPKRPDTVYAGTGVGYVTTSGDAAGVGVYVSRDAGKTWTRPAKNVKGYATNSISVTADGGVVVGTSKGLWASVDQGRSFTEVKLPSNATHTGQAVGAYANWVSSTVVHPSRSTEVTVAIGFGFGKRKGPDGKPLSVGNGLYRSTTGVKGPYTFLAASSAQFQTLNPRSTTDAIGRIALSYGPRDGEDFVLWALLSDAGAANALAPAGLDFVQGTTGQSLNPSNTVLNGAYRSSDDGATWTLKASYENLQAALNESLVVLAGLGYGVGVQGFYNLWIAADPINPDQVYLGLEEVFQSTANAGSTPGLASFEVIQRYWDMCGSTTYFDNLTEGIPCPDGTPKYGGVATHPDQHVGLPVRTASGVRLYTGNDGGFFRQDSHALPEGRVGFDNNGWVEMNTMASTQGYQVDRKPDGEYLIANQDNGAGFFKPGGQEILVSSGDGVQTAATSDPDVWYSSAQGLILYVTKNHGRDITNIRPGPAGASFLSPFAVDPTDENHLVAMGREVMESLKGPDTVVLSDPLLGTVVESDWTSSFDAGNTPYTNPVTGAVIPWGAQALAVRGAVVYAAVCGLCRNSLGDPKLINSRVVTNVKPGCTPKKASSDCWHVAAGRGLPHIGMSSVAIDPQNTRTVYVTLNENSLIGLDKKLVGAQRVMVSKDGGESFTDLTGNLPGSNARDVVVRNGQLIVATDHGVFTAPTTGKSWKRLALGLPAVRMFDLDLDPTGRYLTVSAYGRGVWSLDFQSKATSSSAGPGPKGQPTPGKAGSGGGNLAATGLRPDLPVAAALLLVAGLLLGGRRLRRTRG